VLCQKTKNHHNRRSRSSRQRFTKYSEVIPCGNASPAIGENTPCGSVLPKKKKENYNVPVASLYAKAVA